MLYSVNLVDEIRLWWDKRAEKQQGCKYKVTVNGSSVIYTERDYYNFKNFQAGTEYSFVLEVVDADKRVIGKQEVFVTKTLPEKACINVTKPPYNAVGDGKTDNSEAIKKAFADCTEDKYVYIPLGIYVANGVSFGGDMRVIFDTGAALCDSEGVKNL